MSQSARVESVEALESLRTALAKFAVVAQGALGSAASEIQRVLDGLAARLDWWQAQVVRWQEEVSRAKAALAQRRWGHDNGRGSGATDQEIALEEAKRRLREAEAKVALVRRWQRVLPEAIKEYEGAARQLAGMVEADVRQSLAILDTKSAALEEYAELTAPGPVPVPAAPIASVENAAPPAAPTEAVVEKELP
jgi:hypothetical protein